MRRWPRLTVELADNTVVEPERLICRNRELWLMSDDEYRCRFTTVRNRRLEIGRLLCIKAYGGLIENQDRWLAK